MQCLWVQSKVLQMVMVELKEPTEAQAVLVFMLAVLVVLVIVLVLLVVLLHFLEETVELAHQLAVQAVLVH
jgi:hypothetical protein